MKKLEALVPAAPAGWKLDAPPVHPLGNSTSKGAAFQRVSYTVSYTNLTRVAGANSRAEEMGRQVAELAKQSRTLQRERPKVRATQPPSPISKRASRRWTAATSKARRRSSA